jgi:hypothetical protein
MKNSNDSVRSRGVILFAFSTSEVNYVAIADQTSQLIKRNLNLPITLVTDHDAVLTFDYDHVVRLDPQGHTYRDKTADVQWRNFGRYLAYDLSPYDETLLIDIDYLVLDSSLLQLFDTEFDYRLMRHSCNVDGACHELMGITSLPFVWATVVVFRKTPVARLMFNLVGRIQRNYEYYRLLYNISPGSYRNDFAFSIADLVVNGYHINEHHSIPWRMFTIEQTIDRMRAIDNQIRVYYENQAVVVPYQNIHVMDKQYLQSVDFAKFVEGICEST